MYRCGHEQHAYPELWLDSSRPERAIWHLPMGESPRVERWVDAEALYRDDGFKLLRFGNLSPFKGETFRYSKGRIAFDFLVDRSLSGGTMTGTCDIVLCLEPDMLGNAVSEKAGVEEIVADIDGALRFWAEPTVTDIGPIGVIYVMVFIEGVINGRFARSGSYQFARGQPTILRRRAQASRWKSQTLIHPLPAAISGGEAGKRRESLTRDDDVQLIRIQTLRGPANDGPDAFHYADHQCAFDFSADCRIAKAIPTDTWEVLLDPPHLQGLSPARRRQLGPLRCAEIAGNIEEGLHAWPSDPGYAIETPINRVVFLDA